MTEKQKAIIEKMAEELYLEATSKNEDYFTRKQFMRGAQAMDELDKAEIDFLKNQIELRHKAYLEGVEEIKALKERIQEIHVMITGKDYHKIFDRIPEITGKLISKQPIQPPKK